jgi:hypothetical protein
VEGHALAKQGNVKLVAYIAFYALGDQFGTEVATQLEHAAQDLRPTHD